MKPNDADLTPDSQRLWNDLLCLRAELHRTTRDAYRRTNPFCEDLFDWKEHGAAVFGPGRDITLYDSATVVGDVDVGDGTWIGPQTILDGVGGLTIGAGCSIAAGVTINTHDTIHWALSGGRQGARTQSVRIGDHCFIGTRAIITPGCELGNQCVVGAGSVVTHSYPARSIIAGVPAELIGQVVVDGDEIRMDLERGKGPKSG